MKSGKIVVEEAKDNRTNILKLGMGGIDVYVNDRLSILWEANRLKKSGDYDEGGKHIRFVEGSTLSVEKGYLGITNTDKGKFRFKKDFVDKLNAIIKTMKENGEIENIVIDYYSN